MSAEKKDHVMQIVPVSAEGSRQSSGELRSLGGEAEQISLIASPNNVQSANDTHLDPLRGNELCVEAETVEALLNDSSPSDFLDLSDQLPLTMQQREANTELLPLKQQSLGVKAETAASPSASDILEEVPLTLQQREAINRRHPLKFITGHYGSGKVTVSYTWNCYI